PRIQPAHVLAGLEVEFHRELGDPWIAGLPRPEGAKGRVALDFIESADLIGAVHRSSAGTFWSEVGMIKDVEIHHAELKFHTFGKAEVLGDRHIGIPRARQTKKILAGIAERSKDSRVVDPAYLRRLKCPQIEPALAGHGHARTSS